MTEKAWPGSWARRLRRRVEGSEGPLVQIWGWPGSGKRLLLAELLEAGGQEVPPSLLAAPEALAAAAERARRSGRPFLVCRKWPSIEEPAADALTSTPLLVFTSRRREKLDPSSSSLLSPSDLLLTEAEAEGLWRAAAGSAPERADLEAALEATAGWYRPLRSIAEGVGRGALKPGQPFTDLPELAAFLGGVREAAGDDLPAGLAELGFSRRREELPPILRAHLGSRASRGAPRRATAAPADPGRFRAQLLGMPRVWRMEPNGQETEVRWTIRRSLKIFAFLATNPERRAPRADLVAMAFRDEPEDVVRRNFHPTLSHLRRDLRAGGAPLRPVRQQAGSYFLAPETDWDVDVDHLLSGGRELEALRDAGDLEGAAAVGARTWSLYKGPFLQGEDDPWIVARREPLHRAYLRLLRNLGSVYAAQERLQDSLDAYRAVLLEDPLQETVQTAVMGIYATLGRRDLVRRQYDRLSKLLMAELGVEPLPETTFEYHRLMG